MSTPRFLRRNHPTWAPTHPGKSSWTSVPSIPGAPIHSDLYVDYVKGGGYGVFNSRQKAREGRLEDNLVFYHDSDDMAAFVNDPKYTEDYRFHLLCPLPTKGGLLRKHGRFI